MNNRVNVVAIGLSTLGVIFFMAMAFQILPSNYAIFGGVVCFILAGAVKRFAPQTKE
jgi:hypothetical protein